MKITSLRKPLKVYRPKNHEISGGFNVGAVVINDLGGTFPLVLDIDDRRFIFDLSFEEGMDLINKIENALKTMKGY